MWLHRKTLICLAIALFCGGFMAFLSQHLAAPLPETTTLEPLFPFTEAQILGITLLVQGQIFIFERRFDNPSHWEMLAPDSVPANHGALGFLANLLVNCRDYERFPVGAGELDDYGLVNPQAEIIVHLRDKGEHRIALGETNFDQTKVYARIDGRPEVWLLPFDFRWAISREPAEWRGTGVTVDLRS